jgi:hypothetical protein
MASGETAEGGFDNMAGAVLVWITIASTSDKTIDTSSANGSGQDALALGATPPARIFACAEGFSRTC